MIIIYQFVCKDFLLKLVSEANEDDLLFIYLENPNLLQNYFILHKTQIMCIFFFYTLS